MCHFVGYCATVALFSVSPQCFLITGYLLTNSFLRPESLSHTRSTHNSESCISLNYVQKTQTPAPANPNSDFWTRCSSFQPELHTVSLLFLFANLDVVDDGFLFTFLWKTHSHTTETSCRVRERREKHPYLCLCARRKISLFTRVLVLTFLLWGWSWGAVCTTSAPLDDDSHMISTGLWWNTQGKFDFSRAGFTAAPGCGILFQL